MSLVIDGFAALGVMAYEDGLLPDALAELSVRLELAGAGPLLDQITALEWTPRGSKADPHPTPRPKPPPPTKPTPGDKK
jgi:hypothetical protein